MSNLLNGLFATSCGKNDSNDSCISPIFMILILLFLCGGDNGLLGGCFGGNNECGCGCDNGGGLGGILPILLILCLCGGGGSCCN